MNSFKVFSSFRSIFFGSLALFLVSNVAWSQVNDEGIRQTVLQKEIIDSQFIFGKWTPNGQTETRLRYLGDVTTKTGRRFRVLTSYWIWGLAHRGTSRLLFYDEKNRYVGEYFFDDSNQLPRKLVDGKFSIAEGDGCNKSTTIHLRYGLPKNIFIKCKGDSGDIYEFGTESD